MLNGSLIWSSAKRASGVLLVAMSGCGTQDPGSVADLPKPSPSDSEVRGQAPRGGEVVAQTDHRIWAVHHAKDGTRWFGSNGRGVYRFDGTTMIRFGVEHGLGGDNVRNIQEDRAGNIYVMSDPGGVRRFDGREFVSVTLADASSPAGGWRLDPDDLWFPGGQDTGAVYRFDGTRLHRLTFPETQAGRDHQASFPRERFPAMVFSPYDVCTITKDRHGHLWFGTSTLGVCRYDGRSHAWASRTQVGFPADDAFGVRAIFEDDDGSFAFSRLRKRYEVATGALAGPSTQELRLRELPGLAGDGDYFLSTVKDEQGSRWIATLNEGVWRRDKAGMTHFPVTADGTPIWIVTISCDRQGGIWLGTSEHGVYAFNGKAFEMVRFTSR